MEKCYIVTVICLTLIVLAYIGNKKGQEVRENGGKCKMKNPKERSTAILVGVAAGAILMALMFMIVFGLHTGIAGVVLVLLIVAVSAISGWLIGWNQRIQRSNYYSYMKGYREGLKKKTLIIRHPVCECKFTFPDR